MKTPEEIKEWLKGCDDKSNCSRCPNGYQCDRDAYTLAYIQQLEAQVPKWISVDERLPKPHDDGSVDGVLVTDGALIHMAYYSNDQWYFCSNGEMKKDMFYEVTHWMPLPEPPEEEEHAAD